MHYDRKISFKLTIYLDLIINLIILYNIAISISETIELFEDFIMLINVQKMQKFNFQFIIKFLHKHIYNLI